MTPQEEVSAIKYRISITQSDLVRELLVAYLKGESSTLQTQNIQNPDVASQYSKSACLIRKTAMKAYGQQNKQLNNNLYQAWKQYKRWPCDILWAFLRKEIVPNRLKPPRFSAWAVLSIRLPAVLTRVFIKWYGLKVPGFDVIAARRLGSMVMYYRA